MNLPRVYTCSPSWTPLPSPSSYYPSGSSPCTSPKHPESCIEPGLAISFIYDWNVCSRRNYKRLLEIFGEGNGNPLRYSCLANPMECILLGFSVHGIFQARILDWVAFLLQGIVLTQGRNLSILHFRQVLYHLNQQGSPRHHNCLALKNIFIWKIGTPRWAITNFPPLTL